MPRIRSLAALALALPLALPLAGGCFRYDMRATNTSGQDVRVSLHKGKRHRELSTVVLAPGSSVGWTGQTQRPVLLRVATEPGAAERLEVAVPRRTHTQLDITRQAGQLAVLNAETGQPLGACCLDGSCPDCQAASAAQAEAAPPPPEPEQPIGAAEQPGTPPEQPARQDEPPVDLPDGD